MLRLAPFVLFFSIVIQSPALAAPPKAHASFDKLKAFRNYFVITGIEPRPKKGYYLSVKEILPQNAGKKALGTAAPYFDMRFHLNANLKVEGAEVWGSVGTGPLTEDCSQSLQYMAYAVDEAKEGYSFFWSHPEIYNTKPLSKLRSPEWTSLSAALSDAAEKLLNRSSRFTINPVVALQSDTLLPAEYQQTLWFQFEGYAHKSGEEEPVSKTFHLGFSTEELLKGVVKKTAKWKEINIEMSLEIDLGNNKFTLSGTSCTASVSPRTFEAVRGVDILRDRKNGNNAIAGALDFRKTDDLPVRGTSPSVFLNFVDPTNFDEAPQIYMWPAARIGLKADGTP
jgi:hypothetical protein